MADTVKRYLPRKTRLYIATEWTPESWTRISKRDTLQVVLGGTREDVTAEDSDGYQWEQEVLKTIGLTFSAFFGENGTEDSVYAMLETAKEAGTPLTFAVADADITATGTKYRKIPLFIGQITDNRDTKGVGKIDVETYLGPSANAPTTATVSGST